MEEVVRIERIAAGGDGVGHLADGRAVFVPRGAAGDLASITITKQAARFARGRIQRLLEPSPDRVEPPCRHYRDDECGGCQLQHLSLSSQREARRRIAGDALRRIGKQTLEDPSLAPATAEWGYRTKISLTRGSGGRLGFHRVDRPDSVFPLDQCPVAAPGINDLWIRVRQSRSLWPASLARVVLRLDRTGGEHVIIETGEGPIWTAGKALQAAVRRAASLTVWWRPYEGAVRAVGGSDTAYPAAAFEQINPAMGDAVRAAAIRALGDVTGQRIWDLYAGIGETSALLAQRGALVQSVEWDRRAVDEAERRHHEAGLKVDRIAGSVERSLASLSRPDQVITNPPRTGMPPAVVDELKSRAPARIVYISCDPATLARDIARLAAARPPSAEFRVPSAECYDLFPQTAHVETVAVLERA